MRWRGQHSLKEDPVLGTRNEEPQRSFEDVAKAAVFLTSADSDYVTGEELRIDGGSLAERTQPIKR